MIMEPFGGKIIRVDFPPLPIFPLARVASLLWLDEVIEFVQPSRMALGRITKEERRRVLFKLVSG